MTGVRLGEACAICDEVVDLERGVLEINAQVTSMTLDVYMGRRVVMADAATALDLPRVSDE